LHLTGTIQDVQLEQSWLLPLLRDNITHTELNHFLAYFLPIAFQLQTTGECKIVWLLELIWLILAENLREKGDVTNATVLFTLQDQIWSLFPGYCSYPTDISTSLKLIAKGIGTSLTKRADLRLYLLGGLRNLISKPNNGMQIVFFDILVHKILIWVENDQQEVGKYAKNYLPLLFNLYTSEKWNQSRDPVRQSVFETIKRYLTITDSSLCQTFFDKSLEKMQNTDIDQITLYETKLVFYFNEYFDFFQGYIYSILSWL
jgi:ribosomal RNA-processing protein 12